MLRMIDLCCGIGGIRRGFELASSEFSNVLSADIDPYARATYEHLFGETPYGDITSPEFLDIVSALSSTTGYEVLLAGFPCQAFSIAGKRAGFEDKTRGTVFFSIARIIEATKPKILFLENVRNLISHDKGNSFNTIVDALEHDLGYHVIGVSNCARKQDEIRKRICRNSKDFGVPQSRPRTYIIAFSKDEYGNATDNLPDYLPMGRTREAIFPDLASILETKVSPSYYLSQGYLETLVRHRERQSSRGNGFGFCVLNSPGNTRTISNAILATGGSGHERNLIWQPQPGYAGMLLPGKKSGLNSDGIRKMTPTEWGRLQGFIGYGFMKDGIETFSFPERTSQCQQYKQFGNSVTIPVIEEMATFILDCLSIMEEKS